MERKSAFAAAMLLLSAGPGTAAEEITLETVNAAQFDQQTFDAIQPGALSPLMVKTQILLDRHHMSPGVIDGRLGENVRKALRRFEEARGLKVDGELDAEVWEALGGQQSDDVMQRYTVTEKDLKGPFVGPIPDDWRKMAKMERLAYHGPAEMFSERFHMDLDLMMRLNPELHEARAGHEIVVTKIGENATEKVASIKVDKALGQVLGFNEQDELIVTYPATVGSGELPSPSGKHEIKAIAPQAAYYYRPDKNFQVQDIQEQLKLPPGPNNPIGTVWIDLNKPTYGLHGTPKPAEIDKEASHGCVRLTNWDVEELAELVDQGVPVTFVES